MTITGKKLIATFDVTPTNPVIQKTLVLSTGHLPERLGKDGLDQVEDIGAEPLEGGWWVYVPDHMPSGVVPYDLLRVLMYAHKHGCRWIFFHCDNATTDDLPTWDW
jgi:hypothetical protein